jgi:hypothetical protein
MKIQRFAILVLVLIFSACSPAKQEVPPTETIPPTFPPTSTNLPSTSTPTIEPTISPTFTPTNEPPQTDNTPHTILKIKFPFEPAFPGYLVDIKSTEFTASLMCALEQDKTTGEILNLNQNSNDPSTLGMCDTSSMTLNVLIPDQITVTIILGGFPVVNEVTKKPDSVSEQLVEYSFEYSFK